MSHSRKPHSEHVAPHPRATIGWYLSSVVAILLLVILGGAISPWTLVSILIVVAATGTLLWRTLLAHERITSFHARTGQEDRRQSQLLRAIADGTPDAAFVKDWTGKNLYANPSMARLVDRPVDELIGHDDPEFFDADAVESLRLHDRRVMVQGGLETTEETVTSAGATHTFLVTKAPYRAEDGHVHGVIGVMRDITERKAAELALVASEERYRNFVEVIPDAVLVVEGDRIVYGNVAFRALCGSGACASGISQLDQLLTGAHLEVVQACLQEVLQGAVLSAPLEIEVRARDGHLSPVRVAGLQVVDQTRRAVLVVLRDVSGERRAEALAASVLGHALDGIISADRTGRITSFNPAAERVFGRRAADVRGQHVSLLIPDKHEPIMRALLEDEHWVHERLTSGFRRESVGLRSDGTAFPIDVAISAFAVGDQEQFVGVVRDISEQRKLEGELQQARKMEALGQIAGGVAHDFNNLLTVINGYGELVLDRLAESDPNREFVAGIHYAAERAAQLTRQLLAFSHRAVVRPADIDVNALVGDSCKMLRRVIGADIELILNLGDDVWNVHADPGCLEQVVMNLTINARDAMPSGGRIAITTAMVERRGGTDVFGVAVVPGPFVALTVADTGTGIAPEHLAKIFEPFFTTKVIGKGTGLGLAVVHSLVEQAHGHIFLETSPRGTRFTVELPAVVGGEKAAALGTVPLARGGHEVILLAEDEPELLSLAERTLSQAGYTVVGAPDGAAALELFDRRGDVRLVVTDVIMPRLGGRQLGLALQERRPSLPVLYTSGYAGEGLQRANLAASEVEFLAKPYGPRELLQRVRELLDRSPEYARHDARRGG